MWKFIEVAIQRRMLMPPKRGNRFSVLSQKHRTAHRPARITVVPRMRRWEALVHYSLRALEVFNTLWCTHPPIPIPWYLTFSKTLATGPSVHEEWIMNVHYSTTFLGVCQKIRWIKAPFSRPMREQCGDIGNWSRSLTSVQREVPEKSKATMGD